MFAVLVLNIKNTKDANQAGNESEFIAPHVASLKLTM